MALIIWRRHTETCPHRNKGRAHLKCNCPLWADGYQNGKRTLRQSLETRDLARARKKAMMLESDETVPHKPVMDAVKEFLEHCQSESLTDATIKKYRNPLMKLAAFSEAENIDCLDEIGTSTLDKFRAGRKLKLITASKGLEILRVFFGYCVDRDWTMENPAKKIKMPRNIKPNEVVPFTPIEISAIVRACGAVGKREYERLRCLAMILTLRYTALRIGDVSMLARDRISRDGDRWRIFIRTEKSGQPVFLPVPPDMKAPLDAVPPPLSNVASHHFFWNGTSKPKTHKAHVDRCLPPCSRRRTYKVPMRIGFVTRLRLNCLGAAQPSRKWRMFWVTARRSSAAITASGRLPVRTELNALMERVYIHPAVGHVLGTDEKPVGKPN